MRRSSRFRCVWKTVGVSDLEVNIDIEVALEPTDKVGDEDRDANSGCADSTGDEEEGEY